MFSASVIITTKNRREELLKAVESAMAQRGLLEVVVIDDGSTDGTAEAVLEMLKSGNAEKLKPGHPAADSGELMAEGSKLVPSSATGDSLDSRCSTLDSSSPQALDPRPSTLDPQLRLIRHEVSAGYIVRRNEGARVARGDVIFSLDDDAVFSSPFVVEQTLRDFSHPRIGAVAIPYIEPHKANREMQRAPTREDVWITASYIGTAHAVRRDVFLALGGYRVHLVHQGEEGDFCLRMLAAEQKEKAESGNAEKLKTDLTTEDTESTEGDAGPCLDRPSGAAFSNPSPSELARDSENTSLTHSASGPAGARIAPGGMGIGGGNQLADSEEFLEGQSQAGLQMDSQKHPIHRVATGSDTSGENSSSVPIREIRGKKNSDAPEALSPATSYSLPVTAPEAPGFFVRLGNSDPIIHNESPKRDYSRMDFYGRRNDVLFHWQNTPMPDLLWQLPKTIAGGVVCAAKVGRWRKMLEGIGAGFLAIAGGVKRKPVSIKVLVFHRNLKHSPQKYGNLIE